MFSLKISSLFFIFQLFLCFTSFDALHENVSYQDIMMNAAQLTRTEGEQRNINEKIQILLHILEEISSPLELLRKGSTANEACMKAIEHTGMSLLRKESWAEAMMDAVGKLPSGVALGNVVWLGSFAQCMNVTATEKQPGNSTKDLFQGQYCLATFLPPGPVNPLTLHISIGLCVPSVCSQKDIEDMLNSGLKTLKLPFIANVNNYQPRSIPLDTSAIAMIALLSVIGFAILLGTLYDVCLHQPALQKAKSSVIVVTDPSSNDDLVGDEDRSLDVQGYTPLLKERNEQLENMGRTDQRSIPMRILLAFSMYSNGQKLLNTNKTPGSLDCVHGIRFLSMTWVILGHTVAFFIQFQNNAVIVIDWLKRWTFQAISGGTVSVDSFFVLSGTLVSYLLLKQLKNKNGPRHVNWALFYFHRFWRLTPIYMLVLGTHTALFKYWGSGPVWPYEGGMEPNCKDYWWRNLLYINNLFADKDMCMGWSWYLANDMQFFIISPIVIVAFYYKWFAGAALSLLLIIANFASTAIISMRDHATTVMADQDDVYFKPWCRVGPYVVGIVTGYLLYITEKNKPKIPKIIVALGWIMATACNLAVVYGLVHYNTAFLTPMPLRLNSFYQTCSRTAWGIGLSWVIFACCRGYGGYVNTLLSWPGIIPLSRLTYAAYLVHPIVLFYYNFTLNESVFLSEVVFIWMFLGGLVVSYGFAYITSLSFEAPMMALEKVVFPKN